MRTIGPAKSLWLVWCLAMLLAVSVSGSARAAFGISSLDGQVTDAGGGAFMQAAGHPYAVTVSVRFNTHPEDQFGFQVPWPDAPVKDVIVDPPAGLVGNPSAAAKCRTDELAPHPGLAAPAISTCPSAAQVGVVHIVDANLISLEPDAPIYNMVSPPDVPARLGFNVLGVMVMLDASVRTGSGYAISLAGRNVGEGLPLIGTDVTLWGVPQDPTHDSQRACPGRFPPGMNGPTCTTDAPARPFLRLPTSCPADPSQGLETTVRTDSWTNPGVFSTASFFSHVAPNFPDPGWPGAQQGTTGCDSVPFDPTFTAKPATPASPGASGFVFDLGLPQTDDPNVVGESDLKRAVVSLPAGVRVNPASAGGLGACSPAQIALSSSAVPTCPDSSKVGTLRIDTPLLEQPLDGAVYLAKPHENPSHSLVAIYLVARGPGVVLKLAGGVSPDSRNGQLRAVFDDLPQLPFSNLHLEFFGGVRAPLSNPSRCGTYTTHAVLTGWSGKQVTSDSSFTTSHDGHGAPCPKARFRPSFSAGTTNPVAGKHSSLSVTIARSDDDEELGAIDSIQMPDGLLATIKGVKLCTGVDARAGKCAASSRIGSVTAAAGVGPDPFAVDGKVYLGGRYKHAPFSLVFEVPVIAGPFDLGQITIRSAANIDRHNATLKVVTDRLPTILQGIPLQVRLVNVTIDRKGFILNPTSCATKQITGVIRSTAGTLAHVHDRFQVGECASLGLHPGFSIRVGSKGHTGKGSSTPLKTVLKMPAGGTNLKSVAVRLPLSLNGLLPIINNACTQVQFDTGHCEQARAGSATAITPLLAHGLRGGVYFVFDPNEPAGSLPNLVVALRGQVDFDLVGKIKIPNDGSLGTTFATVPDVPVKKFVLSLVAGSHGPVGVAENLCSPSARRKTASLTFTGQNGLVVHEQQHLHVAGCHRRARR
jgi:hypothetical protein